MYESIWASIEASSWSRDFSYSSYLNIIRESNHVGKPLSEEAYFALGAVLYNEMIKDMCNDVPNSIP